MLTNRWQFAKQNIARAVLASGVHEFRVRSVLWREPRIVTCADRQALDFYEAWAARNFFGRRELVKVRRYRERNLAKGRFEPDGTIEVLDQ